MMEFYKYQGTGNDFIMINGFESPEFVYLTKEIIASLCDRRFGIGADGLIVLAASEKADFKMIYYNSDGGESTMCGNGGRCIARFAVDQNKADHNMVFDAIDGLHEAVVNDDHTVELHMIDVKGFDQRDEETFIMYTGSPHYVKFTHDFDKTDIVQFGREIRYSNEYAEDGINVNVSSYQDDILYVKTYERGVEDETYSCGTGVTAAALCATHYFRLDVQEIHIKSKGGNLSVKFDVNETGFENIWLCGPAQFVFKGKIDLSLT